MLLDAFERTLSQLFWLEFREKFKKSYAIVRQSKAGPGITQ